jgi:hypothetical protein
MDVVEYPPLWCEYCSTFAADADNREPRPWRSFFVILGGVVDEKRTVDTLTDAGFVLPASITLAMQCLPREWLLPTRPINR